jgi:hypothetical protein
MATRELILRIVWPGEAPNAENAADLLGWYGLSSLEGRSTEFGLQRGRQEVVPGVPQQDGSLLFETRVEPYTDKAGRQRFRGDCVQGPPDEPFLYISWRLAGESAWIGRRKVALGPLTEAYLAGLPETATLQTEVTGLGHRPVGFVQEWVAV